jgi:hypothetical protein
MKQEDSPLWGRVNSQKTQCYKENGVEIVTWSKLKPIMEYVEEKYGKNYIGSFKISEKKPKKYIKTDYFVYGNRTTGSKLSSELKKHSLVLQKVYSYEELKKKPKIIFLSQGGTGAHVEEMKSLGAIIIAPIAEWNKRKVIQNDGLYTIDQVVSFLSEKFSSSSGSTYGDS